ncbi:PD-(D/E)XK motif protein [Leclercia adecarboxylata]|uniref:PD-(D/E)XK motif protein n=1 Tax=Leclercia adecarboxylata TaxID=83655 RepID=UPI002DB8D499|nr:PD-(D/E)XK motif protein [Leclercia adecarboxylata]MEB5750758.1 PD-(D/E)XK motif protein [Leclercia adecarboxylata]
MNNTYEDFQSIKLSEDKNVFNVVNIGLSKFQFIAKNIDGAPVFLIKQSELSLYQPDMIFDCFSVTFNVKCILSINDGGYLQDIFCLITFNKDHHELFEVFVRCVSAGLSKFEKILSALDINGLINQLIKLFRSIDKPSTNEVIGLWGELFTIKNSKDVNQAVNSWHLDNTYPFDFEVGNTKYEIKSTTGEVRAHDFSLKQLNGSDLNNIYIISYVLQKSSGGLSILDLTVLIDSLLEESYLKEKLWNNVFQIMGAEINLSTTMSFDEVHAMDNLLYFNAHDIPKPIVNNAAISAVRFKCDLSKVPSLNDDDVFF